MTEIDSPATRTALSRRAASHATTIYRDTPLARAGRQVNRPFRSSVFALMPPDERASDGILAGLALLTLPVVAYTFAQLWSLLAGGSLLQAIRAFLP